MKYPLLEHFGRKGTSFLGCRYPIICGAMTWVSDARLVSRIVENGGFGILACGNCPVDAVREEITRTLQYTDKSFGVNLITVAPHYRAHIDLVRELKVPYVVFAGSFPRTEDVHAVKSAGCKVMCFAQSVGIALRMVKAGADAIILEGTEAGGHIGHVSTIVLLQQVLFQMPPERDIPIFVAGGIATGRMIAHILLMGAAGVQMGTRFVLSDECDVHEDFKKAFIRAKAWDAVATPQFDPRIPVISVRALKNRSTEEFNKLQLSLIARLENNEITKEEAQYKAEEFWMGSLRRGVKEGDIETGSLMAGQSVGLCDRIQPIAEIFSEMLEEAEDELRIVEDAFVTLQCANAQNDLLTCSQTE
ncbi:MAG: NAD(P)H-dependent flavin oxidoreductase [Candidatus Xenobiia bacterium LiM19]